MKEYLQNKKLFVLDMDGTFYLDGKPFEGSLEFLKKVRESGRDYLFFTNNSSTSTEKYVEKLRGIGLDVSTEDIATSADVMIDFLKRKRPGKTVYLCATRETYTQFEQAGIPLTEEQPDLVVLTFDKEITYHKIERMCTFIRQGAEYLCTHPDENCPTATGLIPDCGSFVAMIAVSTGGAYPQYVGKPYRETIDMIKYKKGVCEQEIVFVGDRLETDIAIGARHGVSSALVLTGVTTKEMEQASDIHPTWIFDRLSEMTPYL